MIAPLLVLRRSGSVSVLHQRRPGPAARFPRRRGNPPVGMAGAVIAAPGATVQPVPPAERVGACVAQNVPRRTPLREGGERRYGEPAVLKRADVIAPTPL